MFFGTIVIQAEPQHPFGCMIQQNLTCRASFEILCAAAPRGEEGKFNIERERERDPCIYIYICGPSVGTGLAQRNGADGALSPLHSLGCLFGVWTQDAESMCFHTGELTKTNPRSNPRTNSFGGKVVCTKASARDRPPLGAIPASAHKK